MSRIGKQPILIPSGVTISISENNEIVVKGPKGQLSRRLEPSMDIRLEDGKLVVARPTDQRHHRALHGLTRALINNMVVGVSEGFQIRLAVIGTGYRAEMAGPSLKLTLGYAHDIEVEPPEGMTFQVEDRGSLIIISGIDREMIGQVAADIRRLRPPEPYKGKGIRYQGEVVRQKAGKSGKSK